jgi:hypothetical protein
MTRAKVYEFTGRPAPKFGWHKRNRITIRQAVYEALRQLKRADLPKIVGTVLENHPYYTKQRDRDKQIQFNLWQFTREGIARERPDRRWRPKPSVLKLMAPPKKRRDFKVDERLSRNESRLKLATGR